MSTQLPGPLRTGTSTPFVGRDRELAALRAALPSSGAGVRTALLAGEAGSGKSRLVRELARLVAAEGVSVRYGACDPELAVPYGPFLEALERGGVDDGSGGGVDPALGGLLGAGAGDATSRPEADPDAERLRVRRALTGALAPGGDAAPSLLVVEDVHWADSESLTMLRHLTRAPLAAPLLVVATYRDSAADVGGGLAGALAELRRSDSVLSLRVGGLAAPDVERWLAAVAGGAEGDAVVGLASDLSGLTAGNPFLLGEVWRTLLETGSVAVGPGQIEVRRPASALASPEGVRDVVAARLARLEEGTRSVLEAAALCGPSFRVDVVRDALAREGGDAPDPVVALDVAAAHGMVEPVGASGLTLRFAHELVRRAVVDRLPPSRSAELHLRLGEALEASGGASAADLAHHFTRAAALGGRERAIRHGAAAARAAGRAAAHEAAAAHLTGVLELEPPEPERTDLTIELGTAQMRSGDLAAALESFRAAAGLARAIDDPVRLARAAVGLEEACWRPGIVEAGAVEMLGEAERALPEGEPALRAHVLASLARALAYQGRQERAVEARDAAVAEGRASGDERALARALIGAYFSPGSYALDEVLACLAEARECADRVGDDDLAMEAAMWRVVELARSGETPVARAELAELERAADVAGQPFALHVAAQFDSALALAEGRLAVAEAAAELSRRRGELLRGRGVEGSHGIQMFGIRREQGRLAELAPVARILAEGAPGAWRPGLVALLAETGLAGEAREELRRLLASGAPARGVSVGVAGLVYMAEAAILLGDRESAAALLPDLAARSGDVLMIGQLVACLGAADRLIGALEAVCGRLDAAVAHLERGLALDVRAGFRTWVAWGAHTLAETLRRRSGPGDRERAAELSAQAAALADALGLRALEERLRAPADTPTDLPDDLSPREVMVLRLLAAGRSNRAIAQELVISEHTVANHVRSILRKTGSANRTEAGDYAHRRGLIDS